MVSECFWRWSYPRKQLSIEMLLVLFLRNSMFSHDQNWFKECSIFVFAGTVHNEAIFRGSHIFPLCRLRMFGEQKNRHCNHISCWSIHLYRCHLFHARSAKSTIDRNRTTPSTSFEFVAEPNHTTGASKHGAAWGCKSWIWTSEIVSLFTHRGWHTSAHSDSKSTSTSPFNFARYRSVKFWNWDPYSGLVSPNCTCIHHKS